MAEEELLLDVADEDPANHQEESTSDAVKGADTWMWEEVEDSDGFDGNIAKGSGNGDGDSNSDGNVSADSVELVL